MVKRLNLTYKVEELVYFLMFGLAGFLLCMKVFDDRARHSESNIRRGLRIQERVYNILEGLDIAVIELDPKSKTITYCNKEGNKLLRSIFRKLHPLTTFPDMLRNNDFLKIHLGHECPQEDLSW